MESFLCLDGEPQLECSSLLAQIKAVLVAEEDVSWEPAEDASLPGPEDTRNIKEEPPESGFVPYRYTMPKKTGR